MTCRRTHSADGRAGRAPLRALASGLQSVACPRWRWWLLCLVLVVPAACTWSDQVPGPTVAVYASVWAELFPHTLQAPAGGALQERFYAAARARDEATAQARWTAFVQEFDPGAGGYEDAMHARLVAWAKMEVVRLQHRSVGNAQAERAQIARMRRAANAP